ncbi:MAG: AMP-binding protein, partial [Deltaproteobacteria bacterium]|nr:AMP-binding protein [Deltaproteobacteria bacterium]
ARHHSAIKDVGRAPLFRAALLRVSDDSWEFLASYHRLALDPMSVAILLREILGGAAEAEAGPAPSYSAFMERKCDPAARARDLEYWKGELSGLSSPTRLPGRFPQHGGGPAAAASSISDTALLKLPGELSRAVKEAAAKCGAPLDAFLMAAWGVLLTRASRSGSATFGLAVHGRSGEAEEEGLMGPAWSIVPVTVKADGCARFSDVALETARSAAEGSRHSDVSLYDLEKASPLKNETVGHFFGMRVSMIPRDTGAAKVEAFEARPRAFAFPLAISWDEEPVLSAEFTYDTGHFLPWQIHILSESYLSILASAALDPSSPVNRLKLSSDAQRRSQIEAEAALARVYEGGTAPRLFSKWAGLGPKRPAVAQGARQLSYGDLARDSGSLARALIALGVKPGADRVGLLMDRTPAYPGALLGVLKSGAAAVPLPFGDEAGILLRLQDAAPKAVVVDGPSVPPELSRVLDRASAAAVLDRLGRPLEAGAGSGFIGQAAPAGDGGVAGRDGGPPHQDGPEAQAGRPGDGAQAGASAAGGDGYAGGDGGSPGADPDGTSAHFDPGPCLAEPDSPAYVCYARDPEAEGSLAGVVVSHAALLNLTAWIVEFLDLRSEDTQSAFMPFTSEISFLEILAPLACGARTLVFTEAERRDMGLLYRAAADGGCSSVWLPTGGLKLFASKFPLSPFQILSAAGEGLPAPIRILDPGACRISSVLGVPECAGAVGGESSTPGGVPTSLGFSAPNCPAYVLDDQGELLPAGFTGELYIGGAQTAMGYLNRPELTERLFPPDPFARFSPPSFRSSRLFRTGILAVRHPDGRLYGMGRVSRGPAALPRYSPAVPDDAPESSDGMPLEDPLGLAPPQAADAPLEFAGAGTGAFAEAGVPLGGGGVLTPGDAAAAEGPVSASTRKADSAIAGGEAGEGAAYAAPGAGDGLSAEAVTGVGLDAYAGPAPDTGSGSEAEAEAEAGDVSGAEAEAESESESEAEAEAEAEAESEAESEAEAEAEAGPSAAGLPATGAGTAAVSEPEPEAGREAEPAFDADEAATAEPVADPGAAAIDEPAAVPDLPEDVGADIATEFAPEIVPELYADLAAADGPAAAPDVAEDVDVDLDPEIEPELDADLAEADEPVAVPDFAADVAVDLEPEIVPELDADLAEADEPVAAPDIAAGLASGLGPDPASDAAPDIAAGLASGLGPDPATDAWPGIATGAGADSEALAGLDAEPDVSPGGEPAAGPGLAAGAALEAFTPEAGDPDVLDLASMDDVSLDGFSGIPPSAPDAGPGPAPTPDAFPPLGHSSGRGLPDLLAKPGVSAAAPLSGTAPVSGTAEDDGIEELPLEDVFLEEDAGQERFLAGAG